MTHAATRSWPRWVVAFLIALLAGVALGSLIQTQINLLALQRLGVEVGVGVRITTSLQDLVNFAPIYGALFGASFLVSQLVAITATRWVLTAWRGVVCALAAAVGLWLTFLLVNALAPMPTLIAATRGTGGLVLMLLAAALSGWLLVALATPRSRQPGYGAGASALVVGLLAVAQTPTLEARSGSEYRVETLVDGLEHPWSLAFLPDGSALITERPGRLRLLTADGDLMAEPLTGVPEVFVSGQAGLFDVVLAPDFEDSRQLYLAYACGTRRANHACLSRAVLGEGGLEQVTEVFRSMPAKTGDAHYGGRLAWLADGTLVYGLGDGFDYREEAQNPGSHLGALVRINPDGSVPGDNPFAGRTGHQPEIYSYGHRNIQGLVFDADHGRLIAHEHGPRGGDEINLIRPGHNYGWPVVTQGLDYTGARITPFTERPGMTPPLLDWTPSIAPSGMTLYRGDLFPQWRGDLLVGALAARRVHRVSLDQSGEGSAAAQDVEILFEELGERIRDVRTGPDGAVYLLTDSPQGRLLRVSPP